VTAGLPERVHTWLDRHAPDGETLALACSGGGDSVALLHLASAWAHQRGRRLHVLTVDHGLRPEAADEAEFVRRLSAQLGWPFQVLNWTGDKPDTALQEQARHARHGLLAEACLRLGITHLLLAHTRDDQAETVCMRLMAGGGWQGAAAMSGVAPSPIWPQGRTIRLLRPLLDENRSGLRVWLEQRGETWRDDPSNTDRRYTRIRIRQALAGASTRIELAPRLAALSAELQHLVRQEGLAAAVLARRSVRLTAWGGASLDHDAMAQSMPCVRRRLLDTLILAVSGQASLPSRDAVLVIEAALMDGKTATAGGVLCRRQAGKTWIVRDPGAVLGRVDRPATARPTPDPAGGQTWDGRFYLSPALANFTAAPLGPDYREIGEDTVLKEVPGFARAGLLALRDAHHVLAIAGVWAKDAMFQGIETLIAHRFCTRLLPAEAPVWFDTEDCRRADPLSHKLAKRAPNAHIRSTKTDRLNGHHACK
jgi:tRNA(Ile)-lysidine synthase